MNSVSSTQNIIQAFALIMIAMGSFVGVGEATTTTNRLVIDVASISCSPDFSKLDVEKAMMELKASSAILSVFLANNYSSPSVTKYVDELEELRGWTNSVMRELPKYVGHLGDRLMGLRIELLNSVEKSRLWVALSRAMEPGKRHRIPDRFIQKRAPVEIDYPVEELRVAAALRENSIS